MKLPTLSTRTLKAQRAYILAQLHTGNPFTVWVWLETRLDEVERELKRRERLVTSSPFHSMAKAKKTIKKAVKTKKVKKAVKKVKTTKKAKK